MRDTARGKIGSGEGVIGLTWAFFVAGCPATVVSQWEVESASTSELLLAFHENLKKSGLTTSKALQQAELKPSCEAINIVIRFIGHHLS